MPSLSSRNSSLSEYLVHDGIYDSLGVPSVNQLLRLHSIQNGRVMPPADPKLLLCGEFTARSPERFDIFLCVMRGRRPAPLPRDPPVSSRHSTRFYSRKRVRSEQLLDFLRDRCGSSLRAHGTGKAGRSRREPTPDVLRRTPVFDFTAFHRRLRLHQTLPGRVREYRQLKGSLNDKLSATPRGHSIRLHSFCRYDRRPRALRFDIP